MVAATAVVTAILFAGRGIHLLSETPNLELRYLMPLLPIILPAAVALALPYALAVATALVYGRIVSDREVIAMRLSGMPLQAIVAPALAAGALVSAIALYLHGGPAASAEQMLRLRQRDLADRFLASLSGPDRTIAIKGARISFGHYADGVFHDVEIDRRDPESGRLLQKVTGDQVSLRRVGDDLEIRSPLLWVVGESTGGRSARVKDGTVSVPGLGDVDRVGPVALDPEGDDGGTDRRLRLEVGHVTDIGLATGLRSLIGGKRFEMRPKDMTLPDLLYLTERGEIAKIKAQRSRIELHSRLAAGVTPLVFALLVAAGALQVKAGGRRLLGFLVALTPVFAVHFPLTLFGRSLSESGTVPSAAGVWAATGAAAAIGLLLLRRASLR